LIGCSGVSKLRLCFAQSSAADLDTQMLRDDAKRAAEKLAQFSAELARTSEAASSASANLQCAEQQLKESRDREEQLEAQLQAQVARISELTLELERQKATNATLGARSEEVKRCMSELRSSVATEISEHMARASDASSRAARLQTELAALQNEMGKSTEGFKEQLESIAGLTRQLQGEKNALEKQLNEEQLENGRLRVQTKELEDIFTCP
jgi:chromosome segregation ATPase